MRVSYCILPAGVSRVAVKDTEMPGWHGFDGKRQRSYTQLRPGLHGGAENPEGNVRPRRDNGFVAAGTAQHAPADQPVRVTLLGSFAFSSCGRVTGQWPRPTARRLCELILVSPGRRVSRDLACEELFPRLEPRGAARSLSKALSMARAALAELGEHGPGSSRPT